MSVFHDFLLKVQSSQNDDEVNSLFASFLTSPVPKCISKWCGNQCQKESEVYIEKKDSNKRLIEAVARGGGLSYIVFQKEPSFSLNANLSPFVTLERDQIKNSATDPSSYLNFFIWKDLRSRLLEAKRANRNPKTEPQMILTDKIESYPQIFLSVYRRIDSSTGLLELRYSVFYFFPNSFWNLLQNWPEKVHTFLFVLHFFQLDKGLILTRDDEIRHFKSFIERENLTQI